MFVVAIEGAATGAAATAGAGATATADTASTAGIGTTPPADAGGAAGAGALAIAGAGGAAAGGSGSIGATAVDGAAAGATSAAVTGTSGAADGGAGAGSLATAGAAGGASAVAGAATIAGASAAAGAGATAGSACVVSDVAAAGAAPGTPPVTLIESSLDSSLLAGCGVVAAGGAEFEGELRFESAAVAASDEPMRALLPSCAHAGDASAIATTAAAMNCDARLTLLRFFTLALRRDLSLNLLAKLEHARLGMTAQSDSRHF